MFKNKRHKSDIAFVKRIWTRPVHLRGCRAPSMLTIGATRPRLSFSTTGFSAAAAFYPYVICERVCVYARAHGTGKRAGVDGGGKRVSRRVQCASNAIRSARGKRRGDKKETGPRGWEGGKATGWKVSAAFVPGDPRQGADALTAAAATGRNGRARRLTGCDVGRGYQRHVKHASPPPLKPSRRPLYRGVSTRRQPYRVFHILKRLVLPQLETLEEHTMVMTMTTLWYTSPFRGESLATYAQGTRLPTLRGGIGPASETVRGPYALSEISGGRGT